jgi:hypothetical protein
METLEAVTRACYDICGSMTLKQTLSITESGRGLRSGGWRQAALTTLRNEETESDEMLGDWQQLQTDTH